MVFSICVYLCPSAAHSSNLDDARGVTGPEPAPPAPVPVWRDERAWAVALAVVAVTAAVLAGRRHRPPPAPEPPPGEWAAAELDRLAQSGPDADGLAAVLRGFLARQFHVPAAATTAEVIHFLGATGVSPVSSPEHGRDARGTPGPNVAGPNAADWQSLLERCDVARFANVAFTPAEWATAVDQARRVIAESLPVAEPAGSAATGAAGKIT
jgi:hypothetical protein